MSNSNPQLKEYIREQLMAKFLYEAKRGPKKQVTVDTSTGQKTVPNAAGLDATTAAADRYAARMNRMPPAFAVDTGGIGGTLAGNALSLASMRATLSEVLTQKNFDHMIALGTRWSDGVDAAITEFDLPWTCNRLGARGEYMFGKSAPVTGADANKAGDFELEQYIHLRMLNDGFLITPFHNMALMCPDTSEADVDAHTKAFKAMCQELVQ